MGYKKIVDMREHSCMATNMIDFFSLSGPFKSHKLVLDS